MIELKATAELSHQFNDAKGKPLPHPLTTLTVKGELLPAAEVQHHILAALLNESNPPKVDVEFTNVNNVLSFTLTFEHDEDVVEAGRVSHALAVEARNSIPPITVAELKKRKEAAAKAQADAEANAKAEAAKAAK